MLCLCIALISFSLGLCGFPRTLAITISMSHDLEDVYIGQDQAQILIRLQLQRVPDRFQVSLTNETIIQACGSHGNRRGQIPRSFVLIQLLATVLKRSRFPYAVMASMDTASSLEELHFMNIPPLRLSNVAGVLLNKIGNRSMKKFSQRVVWYGKAIMPAIASCKS